MEGLGWERERERKRVALVVGELGRGGGLSEEGGGSCDMFQSVNGVFCATEKG